MLGAAALSPTLLTVERSLDSISKTMTSERPVLFWSLVEVVSGDVAVGLLKLFRTSGFSVVGRGYGETIMISTTSLPPHC